MYRTINSQLMDITLRVTDKFRVKQNCNAWATDKTFKCWKNIFVPERVRQESHVLLSHRRCTWYHGPPFYNRYSSVSMHSLSVILRSTCGQCPERLWLTRCMSGSSLAANQVHQTSMDGNWTNTKQGTHEFRIKRMPAHSYRTSSGRLLPRRSLFQILCMQNFPLDWTDLAWQGAHLPNEKRTRNPCGQDKRIENIVLCQTSVNAIR